MHDGSASNVFTKASFKHMNMVKLYVLKQGLAIIASMFHIFTTHPGKQKTYVKLIPPVMNNDWCTIHFHCWKNEQKMFVTESLMHYLDLKLKQQSVQVVAPHFTMEEHLMMQVSCQKLVLDDFVSPCPTINAKYYVASLHDKV
jgi:hypothetical protein